VLELRRDGAHAAAAKYVTMRDWLNPDNRIRGSLIYHGCAPGRWSSKGVQLQNFKRDGEAVDVAAIVAGNGTLAEIGAGVRNAIAATSGHRFIIADFSGIESRVAAWLTGEQWKVDQWASFDASGKPEDEPYYLGGLKLGFPPDQARACGKTADLAFGYMGGIPAYRRFAPAGDQSTDEDIKRLQTAWRRAHPNIARFWRALDTAAIRAVANPGKMFAASKKISFVCEGNFLFMNLPSGRRNAYPFPRLIDDKFGDKRVVFKDTAFGKFADCRNGEGAYGGTWIENAVQALSRDLLAAAMLRLEAAGYPITFHIHDEIVAEVPDDFGSAEEFSNILLMLPDWATGLPMAAKVRNGPRFAKAQKSAEPPPAEEAAESEPEPEPEQETPRSKGNGHDPFRNYTSGKRDYGDDVEEYLYQDAGGRPYQKVKRTSTKQFPQSWWNGSEWKKGDHPNGPLPYRLPELLKASPDATIYVTEGEKDCNTSGKAWARRHDRARRRRQMERVPE
jgi:DNA polymerase